MCIGEGRAELTEDEGNDNGLDILRTGLVGISREISNVKAQGGIVSQNAVEVCTRYIY